MDETKSKKLALELLKAVTAEEVNSILASEDAFAKDENWRPYGNQHKNWDRIGNQTSEPVGALAELLINSIDAILMRKNQENKAPRPGMPKSMDEAVRQFFPQVSEGKIANLKNPREMTQLAENCVLVGVKRKRKKYPTYTIADFGEGQNSTDFPQTLLSLGENNKEGLPFVQGRFNMGSTGSITFCTQAEIRKGLYKLIISKRTLPNSDNYWGWTLIRTRKVKEGEDLPVVEYFYPGGEIPKFKQEDIQAFGRNDIGVITGGTVLKLYEYDIGPNARAVDFGLSNALTTSLLECALPIRIYDFDATPQPERGQLRQQGIADRTFSGMRIAFGDSVDANVDLPRHLVVQSQENPSLGKIRIFATGLAKLPEYMTSNYQYRVFYTINGQAQAKERASFLGKAKLDDLRQHLIVQIDCNEMDKTARSAIFKPDRERMQDIELARELKHLVIDALKNDRELHDYARKVRLRRVRETIQDTKKGNELWKTLIRDNPGLRELLGSGDSFNPTPKPDKAGKPFEGEKFPTELKLLNPQDGVLLLPINTYRIIRCKTDAENNYLSREFEQGKFLWDNPDIPHRVSLRNGELRIRVYPPINAPVGYTTKATFGFDDGRAIPLTQDVTVKIEEEVATSTNPPGETRTPKQELTQQFPNIVWVKETEWNDHGFDENSGAYCADSQEGFTIYVNRDNRSLLQLLASESDENERELTLNIFMLAVGILTLAIQNSFDKGEGVDDWDNHLKYASSAISSQIVTLIKKLGGAK